MSYKTGDKFIIELGEQVGDLFKVKGFNALVFDEYGLDKLCHLMQGMDEDARVLGQREAWELARRITMDTENGGMTYKELKVVFFTDDIYEIMADHTYAEASEKVEAWEKEKAAPKLTVRERALCQAIKDINAKIRKDWCGFVFIEEGSDEVQIHDSLFPFIEKNGSWYVHDLLELEVAND